MLPGAQMGGITLEVNRAWPLNPSDTYACALSFVARKREASYRPEAVVRAGQEPMRRINERSPRLVAALPNARVSRLSSFGQSTR